MADEKKGILRFEEGMKQFTCWSKEGGLTHPQELAVDIYLDNEDIGYITGNGNVTISGCVTEQDPCTIMSYYKTLTIEQWTEIGAKAKEFKGKCAKPDREKLDQGESSPVSVNRGEM